MPLAEDVTVLRGARDGHPDDPACFAALARLAGLPVVVVAQRRRGDGTPAVMNPAGYRKARRAMALAAELRLPLVTIVDTPGAELSEEAERGGLAGQIAGCLADMAALPVPTLAMLLGEGGSGGALALLAADRVLAAEHASLGVIAPEGASAILYRDLDHAAELAATQGGASWQLLDAGIADALIPEPRPAHEQPDAFVAAVGAALLPRWHRSPPPIPRPASPSATAAGARSDSPRPKRRKHRHAAENRHIPRATWRGPPAEVNRRMKTLEEIAYDAGRHALADQESLVNGIRQRTGTLLAAHALVASFLGAAAIRVHGLHGLSWVALASLVAGLVVAATLLGPWKLTFAMDARNLYAQLFEDEAGEGPSDTLTWLATAGFGYQELRDANAPRVHLMSALSVALGIFMVTQTLAWIAELVR